MTAIELHILNSYDPVFYNHRSEIAVSDVSRKLDSTFCFAPADVLVLKADSIGIF